MKSLIAALTTATILGSLSAASAQESVSITRQPGILYLASHVMETQNLIEKHAAAKGIEELDIEWLTFSGGGAQTDALLAGNVDIVNTGTGNLLLLWDRTRGGVKGIVTSSAQPVIMVSNDPEIRSLEDIGPDDRIAVPTVGVSTQAILLQMAAAQMFGEDEVRRFDANTVQLGHPDAVAAISNPMHEVKSHFSAPPFQYVELEQEGVHRVTDSREIIGPLTQATFFTTTDYAEENPLIVQALREATVEAVEMIKADPRAALEAYKTVSGDQTPIDELMVMMEQPHMLDEFRTNPVGTMKMAEHLFKIGTLTRMPEAWTDYYLPESADLDGS